MSKAKYAGMLEVISGLFGLVFTFAWLIMAYLEGFFSFGESGYLSTHLFVVMLVVIFFSLLASSLALVGGLSAQRKRRWGLALAGAIFSIAVLFPCGIPALIFIAQARSEFSKIPVTI